MGAYFVKNILCLCVWVCVYCIFVEKWEDGTGGTVIRINSWEMGYISLLLIIWNLFGCEYCIFVEKWEYMMGTTIIRYNSWDVEYIVPLLRIYFCLLYIYLSGLIWKVLKLDLTFCKICFSYRNKENFLKRWHMHAISQLSM